MSGPEAAEDEQEETEEPGAEESDARVRYDKGLEITSRDGNYRTHVDLRFQGRFSSPFDSSPRTPAQFEAEAESSFEVNRGRIKIGGHAYRPWLEYYVEYDFPSSRLLDFRFTLTKYDWLQLRVGQGKAIYSQERVVSSGKQQFVERSIVNREFTIASRGCSCWRLAPGTRGDSRYWAGVFSGGGRDGANTATPKHTGVRCPARP